MTWGTANIASTVGDVKDFIVDLFAGVAHGDIVSIVVVGILALLVLRFVAARWVFTLAKQVLIFGGLAFGVWYGAGAIGDRNQTLGTALLYGGEAAVALLFLVMLYMFFLRRAEDKDAARRRGTEQGRAFETRAPAGEKVRAGREKTGMRVGTGPLQGHGLKVHYEKVPGAARPAAAGGGAGGTSRASAADDPEHSRLEDILRKMNVLGTSRDQNLLTVMVLILVAEFGVFTSRTISAPNPEVGMFLFAVFALGAVVFVKTSYKNYWTGVRHFVFATIFALALSVVMLKFWQQTYCPGSAGTECAEDLQVALTWGRILTPDFYFQSDGLIAAITAVAFSTLLTKGGG